MLLLLSAMLFSAPLLSHGAESLYDSTTARKLDPSQLEIFGPQSSKYRYDSRMIHAAQIAQDRARGHSIARCWRFVKDALLASNTVSTRPKTAYAKQAGAELQKDFGFKKLKR